MNKKMFLKVVLLVCVFVSVSAIAGDWPQWRGVNRDGYSTDTGLSNKWPSSGPKLVWKIKTIGEGFSTPSVANGKIYVMGDKDGACRVFALKESDGKILWDTKVGEPGGHKKYPGPRSTPTVDGNVIYSLTQNGDLYCLAAKDGKVVWQKNLGDDFGGKMMSGWKWSESVLIDGDKLLCTPGGTEGTVIALNKKTGKKIWRCKDLTDPASYSSIMNWNHGGVPQYVQFTSKSVAGIDAKTGKLLWRGDRPGKTAIVTTPVMKDDMVFVTSAYNIGCNMFKVDVSGATFSTKEVYANKDLQSHHGGVVLVGDHVYGTSKKTLVCMDIATGKVVWEDDSVGKGAIAYADGMLVVRGEKDGAVALVKAEPGKYQELGRFDQPDRSDHKAWPHPVIANGRLYLRDQDLLLCYDLTK
ncbi:MAG: PQQ-like beta-propeller repeat protein [Kiritimatiellales bacterium]|nr:PQQ-like beta-propeller repeat protein [Kiritimatiellales bacterium]